MLHEPLIDDIARNLKATRCGGAWKARCPCHDDMVASLSLSIKDGKLLVYCHAGCEQSDLIAALRERGLWPEARPNGKANGRASGRQIVATYDYVDAAGELLFQSVRYIPKDFRQRRPDGAGGWIWNLQGVEQVPYLLPDLIEAIAGDRPIFVVEGEKDVDSLARVGIAATCNAGGAGKWRKVHAEALRGANVIILPDNDDPGRKHGREVAASLQGIAARVRVVELVGLPDKGDVSDWLANGGTAEKLWALVEHARDWQGDGESVASHLYRSRVVADIEPQPIDWLWYRRLALGKLNLIAGHPGGGKSQLAALMAAHITTGRDWPDGAPCPVRSVILVSCEDDAADTIRPRLEAAGADLRRVHILDKVLRTARNGKLSEHLFDLGHDLTALEAMVRDVGDVGFINIDPVLAYCGGIDSHKTSDVRGQLAPLQTLAAETHTSVVLISHLNKGSAESSAMARVSGSGAYVATCRSAWILEIDPKDQTKRRRVWTPLKNNIGDDRTGFAFQIEQVVLDGGLETSRIVFEPGTVEISAHELLANVSEDTEEDRGAVGEAMDFLREVLSAGPQNAKWALKEAGQAGIAERTLRRARAKLGVRARKSGMTGCWLWEMPGNTEGGQETTS